ncbi:MAG: hypothetical protein IK132_12080 [Clostridia bacterium]|nr:hypothetical protein [Clostridia bacterium]
MKKMICERCGEEYEPLPDYAQDPAFGYRVMYYRGLTFRHVGLCEKCQKDLDRWLKEKTKREGEAE